MPSQSPYIFQVELLIEEESSAKALEKLIHSLNQGNFIDYRIHSGVELGRQLEQVKAAASTAIPIPVQKPAAEVNNPSNSDRQTEEQASDAYDRMKAFMKSNKLIRLIVNKGLGIKLSIPCRIINLDVSANVITVYHVDEKQVYTFRLNEIEDIID
ncbi:hypothetical protein ACFO9Q_06065 [Paenibacillus sp. GCM10023252]|uniref:hypothetical protein n=1 Tax=Paenibacillus sp. GCM10023252 TaxID=3252649 RepID=UPI0036217E51